MNMAASSFAKHVDVIIKVNSTVQIIPSVEEIAEEVLRKQEHNTILQRGTCVLRELWQEHRNETGMVRDASLAYRDTYDNKREIYCLVCLT